jgi:prepilin-type N-terminal cleavage/methylation domain-containing protein
MSYKFKTLPWQQPILVIKNRDSVGFSLIEVLVSLLISGILIIAALSLYLHAKRRSLAESEAIALATRIQQAESLAQSGNVEFRIIFDTVNNQYRVEKYNAAAMPPGWVTATELNNDFIPLNKVITFSYPAATNSPMYGPTVAIIASATSPVPGALAAMTYPEIRFNSKGFPVEWYDSTQAPTNPIKPPTVPRETNAIYLGGLTDYFAITVNITGRVQVWAYTAAGPTPWVLISN